LAGFNTPIILTSINFIVILEDYASRCGVLNPPDIIKEALGIPSDYTLITLVAVGYPGDEGHLNEKHLELGHSKRDRKPPEEVIYRDTWKL